MFSTDFEKRLGEAFAASDQGVTDKQDELQQMQERYNKNVEIYTQQAALIYEHHILSRVDLLAQRFENVKRKDSPVYHRVDLDFLHTKEFPSRTSLVLDVEHSDDLSELFVAFRLSVAPQLVKYTPYKEVRFPLQAVNLEHCEQFLDDAIIEFLQTYLSIRKFSGNLKRHAG
jgi:hypothetical protein